MDLPQPRRDYAAPFERRGVAERGLIDEITSAARLIAAGRDWYGDPVFRTDGVWRVVTTVASSRYCLAIADLARALGVRRQVAHELAHEAARQGLIELAPNPAGQTDPASAADAARPRAARGRSERAVDLAGHAVERSRRSELAATTHVVRVVRQRLERDAREWAQRQASR